MPMRGPDNLILAEKDLVKQKQNRIKQNKKKKEIIIEKKN